MVSVSAVNLIMNFVRKKLRGLSPLILHGWIEECVFVRPPVMEALPHVDVFNSKDLTKLHNTRGNSTNRKDIIGGFIPSLLLRRRPSAIFFTVAKIVIFPIKRKTNWFLSHVFKEVSKFFPFITNSNSSPAVGVVSGRFRVVATKHHIFPAKQCSTFSTINLMTVNKAARPSDFPEKAPAGFRVSNNQIAVDYRFCSAAFALAYASFKSCFGMRGGDIYDF